MKPFFYMDGSDLMCEMGTDTYKLGEVNSDHFISFDYLSFSEKCFNYSVLEEAAKFAEEAGYKINKELK